MLKGVADLTSQDFSKGLNTISDIFNLSKDQSPNMMNVKVNFDGSVQKRLGTSTMNSVSLGGQRAAGFTSGLGTLTNNLIAWWKMDETGGARDDSFSTNHLTDNNTVSNAGGILGNAALFTAGNSEYLSRASTSSLVAGDEDFTISSWFYLNSTGEYVIASKRDSGAGGGAQTVLLLHCDGTDGATTFTDSSDTSHTVTANGNAQIDTDQSKFGGASGLFDGTGDYLSIPDSADWDFGTGDWTIDFLIRFNAITGRHFLVNRGDNDGAGTFAIEYRTSVSKLIVGIASGEPISASWSPSINIWYHVAVSRKGSDLRAFIDGIQIGTTAANSSDITGALGIRIGASTTDTFAFNGWLDEIRISKGTARWTSNFTPPSEAYRNTDAIGYEYQLYVNTDNFVTWRVSSSGTAHNGQVRATSFGAVSTATWYHALAWHQSSNVIGVSVNANVTTDNTYSSGVFSGTAPFAFGSIGSGVDLFFNGRIDESGFWRRAISDLASIKSLYGDGSGTTYDNGFSGFSWASFDFGASANRWYVVAAGTGLYASSDLGVNFTSIASDRSAAYQTLERSKNVLIATSDAYNNPLQWSGSGGTYAAIVNSNAPLAKYSINFQGFLILLNTSSRKRAFFYQDENTQLSGTWANVFDIPSVGDDEITTAFVLKKRLYVSTRYRLYRVSYVGGNPDWSYLEIKNWGFVPRTVKKLFLKDIGEVAIGLSWDRRIRAFDGSEDKIISDNIENDNSMCDFALSKLSFSGSGLTLSFAESDENEQVYKLCTVLGENSTQTTNFINFSGRSLAFYPYSNTPFNTMAMVESANRRYLLAADRSGYIHMLDTSNRDVTTAINDLFDSSFLFDKSPSQTTKGYKVDFFFSSTSSNNVYIQDRTDFSGTFRTRHILKLENTGGQVQVMKSIGIPTSFNTYQYRIASSSGTSDPWKLNRVDTFVQGMGIGKVQ